MEKEKVGGKGIDIGTAFIKCAKKEKNEIVFVTQRNAFFEIEQTDYTRGVLDRANVKYILKGDKMYVVGDDALEFANMFNKETRRPLSKGIISPTEREALPMVELLIKNVVGKPAHNGEIIYYSVPGEPIDAKFNIIYHEKILDGFLRKLGYTPKSINEGHAIILSELANENFTGIGFSFGAGMVNVCFSYKAVPVFQFSVTKSGDWIDQQVSMATNETSSKVCSIKETSLDLSSEDNKRVESALSIYYNHLIEYAIENIKQEMEKAKKMPQIDKPISIVLSGGTSLPEGFDVRFKKILEQLKFPLKVGNVKRASQPLNTVAKGALVAASADESKK
ncbi:MAG: hypothetical protein ISS82_04605 [Nanoarchaeota archaeon]|nr:hypothetical protein [Nanoarchaeota archaeon]